MEQALTNLLYVIVIFSGLAGLVFANHRFEKQPGLAAVALLFSAAMFTNVLKFLEVI